MTIVAEPVDLRLLVEEQAGRKALAELLEAEPLDRVGLETLTGELEGRRLSVEVSEGVLPGIARVGINLPAVPLLGGCPVGHAEALEDGAGLAVEGNLSDALLQRRRMEVLCIDVVHEVGLLVELVVVEVLNADANLTALLDVELVCYEREVWVDELHKRAGDGLKLVARIIQDLDPANLALPAQRLLQGAVELSLCQERLIDSAVQKTSLELHHYDTQ